ncbi:DUF1127 domain-containing protein [Oceanospirillum sediminis]|uniref:DUF1127 domain-containing protein n=1 Tax=Oceanospirillum sediminis TaxID=2760088 RepID=A0A839ITA8_9GAMM|nr:DUF1127 domain-containing protein [Oceanospirillum sediminis]MBB1487667.1 DUF1127 domain-containing protein [Oceanospirillum sediminis]
MSASSCTVCDSDRSFAGDREIRKEKLMPATVKKQSDHHCFRQVTDKLLHWIRNYQTREQLRYLDKRQLKDIGLSNADVSQELNKPFWKD